MGDVVQLAGDEAVLLQLAGDEAVLLQLPGDEAVLQIKKGTKNSIKEVGDKIFLQIEGLLKKKAEGIVSISRVGENWNIQIEVLERKAIPDTQNILGIYELKLNSDLEIIEYKRIGMRHKGDMIVQEEY
jgi:hypothetical protein